MSPNGFNYLTKEKFDLDFVNFYQDGLATVFNCKRKNEKVLTCNYSVKFAKEDSDYSQKIEKIKSELRRPGFEDKKVWMLLEDEKNWDKVKDLICKKLKGSEFGCQNLEEIIERRLLRDFNIKGCQCDGIGIYLKEGIIFYEYER